MTVYGYARVSTLDQNLERQLEQLRKHGCEEIFMDKISGATTERPELQRLFEIVKEGDIIIIKDLTRFTRSTSDLFKMVDILRTKKVGLKSIEDKWLDLSDESPYSQFLMTVMAGVSQLERDLIKMRQAEGIELAKKNGVYKGRPKTFTENNPRLKHALDQYESGQGTVREVCAITGINESTFYRSLRERRRRRKEEAK
jgi:DNA invertase Pin-like site-specific DNA recombinase